MRKGFGAAIWALLLAMVGPAGASDGPIGQPGPWTRVFAEDFNGTALDTERWTTCYWWDDEGCTNLANNELQWYRPENVSQSDGRLRLTAKVQAVTGYKGRPFSHTSGLVTSGRYYEERALADRFAFQYGHVEVRARPPAGQGLWSALWLLPSTQESKPEIDIMEVLGHRPDVLEMHFHCGTNACKGRSFGHEVSTHNLADDWHVYGVGWSPEAVVWFLDGVEQWRYDDQPNIPREPMYLLMNLAVGGDWPGAPDQSTRFPAEFGIDSVRIWQRPAR